MRARSRMIDVSINAVTKLLVDAGRACSDYQFKHLRNLFCKRIQCDEIWSFCYAKVLNSTRLGVCKHIRIFTPYPRAN